MDIQASTLEDFKKYRAGSAGGKNNVKTQFLTSHGFEVELVDEGKQNIDKLFQGTRFLYTPRWWNFGDMILKRI